MDLSTQIGKLKLKNPIMVASGTFGYGDEFDKELYPIGDLGGIFSKGISLEPWGGNAMPRIIETASGMLNAIGLQNIGLEKFISEKIPYLKDKGVTLIVNVVGKTIDEYTEVVEKLDAEDGVSGFEINISCPNVKEGGIQFGTDPKMAAKVTKACRKKTKKTLIMKLSPNVTDIVEIGKTVEGEGACGVSAINTITGMAIDIETRRPILANKIGGLSGPAIKPVALRMVWQLAQNLKIPVIGIGGISSIKDVIEFLLAGASAVQIGTANFVDPMISHRLVGELKAYCDENNISNLKDLIGKLEV